MPRVPNPLHACTTCSTSVRPPARCSTFARFDFSRVPFPAANTTTTNSLFAIFVILARRAYFRNPWPRAPCGNTNIFCEMLEIPKKYTENPRATLPHLGASHSWHLAVRQVRPASPIPGGAARNKGWDGTEPCRSQQKPKDGGP